MDALKRQAAARALEHVRDGMKLGLGTGSTAKHFVDLLGEKVRAGLNVVGVPTSEATRAQAERMRRAADHARRDRPPRSHRRRRRRDRRRAQSRSRAAAALLRGKIVAAASDRMIVIADETKWVDALGRFPLPVEVIPFGLAATSRAIGKARLPKAAFPGKWCSGRARTATFLSPMAATGSSTPISDE